MIVFVYNIMEFPKRAVISTSPVVTPGLADIPRAPTGYATDQLSGAAAPPSTTNEHDVHCNILPPPPRSQIVPPKCQKKWKRPFKRGELYLGYSPAQNVFGLIDGGPGKSVSTDFKALELGYPDSLGQNNANWVRGNQFSDMYPQVKLSDAYKHHTEINVGKLLKNNPIVEAKSEYFPEPDQCIKKNKWYLQYPYKRPFSATGQPMYNQETEHSATFYFGEQSNPATGMERPVIVEGFNPNSTKSLHVLTVTIFVIALFLMSVMLIRMRR